MKRNLQGRVEVVIPIEEPLLRRELRTILDVQLSGDHGEWGMQSDGTYVRHAPEGDFKSSQQLLIELAEKRQREAGRRRKLRPKGVARRAAKVVP
jgi:polyphosphate kinase